MLKTDTCKHFNGIVNACCKMGIDYSSVAALSGMDDKPSLYDKVYPCCPLGLPLTPELMYRALIACPHASYPTKEEEAEDEARVMAEIREQQDKIKNNICPTHDITITKRQVGRCVYGEPCGCRLYQGKLKNG